MSINKVDGQTPVVPVAPAAAPKPAEPAKPVETARPADATAFTHPADTETAKALGTAPGAHVPLPSILPGEMRPPVNMPLPMDSARAQDAIAKSYEALSGPESLVAGADAKQRFTPKEVFADELGMTHVRMDRMHEGVKVFGEQVITHLGQDGQVSSITGDEARIPEGLGSEKPKLSAKDATELTLKELGTTPGDKPTVERVIAKGADGQYHDAYHVVAMDVKDGTPRKMNYLVDANTGKVTGGWNQIDPFIKKSDLAGAVVPTVEPVTDTQTVTPRVKIKDLSTVTSTINVGKDFDLTNVQVNLNIRHSQRGDLVVSLTSPSGKTVVISNREGGSADNIKGTFDLSAAFQGEPAYGQWTLTVEDQAKKHTGSLNSWTLSLTGTGSQPPAPTPGAADDTSMYSGQVEIGATQNADGTYKLLDSTRGQGVETRDAMNRSSNTGAVQINDDNNVWGEAGDPTRNQTAVDAQYGGQMTYDFYKNILGRDSIDGKGEKLISNVHIGRNYVNAYWDGNQMNYGDGNNTDASPLTSLDIAGHEITHGLTERTAGLIYSGESGGINEAMSDIMGKGVEWYASQQNPAVKFTWGVGEVVWTPGTSGDALRYMNDPTKDGYSIDNYKDYPKQTEVHGSSGIMNNAFTLLVEGGTNKTSGIQVDSTVGMQDALRIYGRALTTYMTPSTTFAQARDATLQAATDLFGASSVQVQKVKESWHAVGVG